MSNPQEEYLPVLPVLDSVLGQCLAQCAMYECQFGVNLMIGQHKKLTYLQKLCTIRRIWRAGLIDRCYSPVLGTGGYSISITTILNTGYCPKQKYFISITTILQYRIISQFPLYLYSYITTLQYRIFNSSRLDCLYQPPLP